MLASYAFPVAAATYHCGFGAAPLAPLYVSFSSRPTWTVSFVSTCCQSQR